MVRLVETSECEGEPNHNSRTRTPPGQNLKRLPTAQVLIPERDLELEDEAPRGLVRFRALGVLGLGA